jgi:mRNA interferase MazF
VVTTSWVPDVGDLVWLQFNPQAGHEQAGHRPALVLTPARYNSARGMMLCCPMTSRIKGYAFEVVVTTDPPSAVLADQIESLDWRARRAVRRGNVSTAVLAEVRAKIKALLTI